MDFHKIWLEQCEATYGIKEQFGSGKALGYLIGEKLVNHIHEADINPDWAGELPLFIAEIKQIFSPQEIRDYLKSVRRTGPLGHACTDEEIEIFREAGAVDDDPVRGAEDMLIMARIEEMILERGIS